MQLKELKSKIEYKDNINNLIVFVLGDNKDETNYFNKKFLVNQYIDKISKINKVEKDYVNSVQELLTPDNFWSDKKTLKIYIVDNLNVEIPEAAQIKNKIIVCDKINNKVLSTYKDLMIEIPIIEDWQIKDYALSKCKGIKRDNVLHLVEICNLSLFRIDSELNKLLLFDEKKRDNILIKFINEGVYSDLTNYNIFFISNNIIKRNKAAIGKILENIDNIDFEPLALVKILITNFREIIDVQLTKDKSALENIYPIKKIRAIENNSCGIYNEKELYKVYKMLLGIDKKIKLGQISTQLITPYIISFIFSL